MVEANPAGASGGTTQRQRYDSNEPLLEQLVSLVRTTHCQSRHLEVIQDGSSFMLRKGPYFNGRPEYKKTEDLGNKGLLHRVMGTERNAAEDVFSLATNSCIEVGAVPIELLFSVSLPTQNDPVVFNIVDRFVELARISTWAIRGEERRYSIIVSGRPRVSILNGLDGIQVEATVAGYCRPDVEIVKAAEEGDVLIGIGSNGIHCSGVAGLRDKFMAANIDWMHMPFGSGNVGDELTKPTRSYLMSIKRLMNAIDRQFGRVNSVIHGMVHMHSREWRQEGGFLRLKELTGNTAGLDVFVSRNHSLAPQAIFQHAHREFGIGSSDMYRWFNNGIGYVICIEPARAEMAVDFLRGDGLSADVIGSIRKSKGFWKRKEKLLVESQYDDSLIEY